MQENVVLFVCFYCFGLYGGGGDLFVLVVFWGGLGVFLFVYFFVFVFALRPHRGHLLKVKVSSKVEKGVGCTTLAATCLVEGMSSLVKHGTVCSQLQEDTCLPS